MFFLCSELIMNIFIGHSPYLSQPEVVLRVIDDVCHTK
jgi:hypothetical protein